MDKKQVGKRCVYLPGCIHENKSAMQLLSLSLGGRGGLVMLTMISVNVVSHCTAVADMVRMQSKEQRCDPFL